MTASQKFESEAERWEETGTLSPVNEYYATKLHCWIGSSGAETDGVSERLKRYHAEVEAQITQALGGNWYDKFLRVRDRCSVCGEGFRLANLGLCTHCDALIGYCHQFEAGLAPDGNPKCPRCADGEIVG